MNLAPVLAFLAGELAAFEKAAGFSTDKLFEKIHEHDRTGGKKGTPAAKHGPWLTVHGLLRELKLGTAPQAVARWARKLLAARDVDVDAAVAGATAPRTGAGERDTLAWVIAELEQDALPKEVRAWLDTLDPAVARWLRQRGGG